MATQLNRKLNLLQPEVTIITIKTRLHVSVFSNFSQEIIMHIYCIYIADRDHQKDCY